MGRPREHKSIRKLCVSAGQCSKTKSKAIVPYPVLKNGPFNGLSENQAVKPIVIYT